MAPLVLAAVTRAPQRLCVFLVFMCFLNSLFVRNSLALTCYDKDTLLRLNYNLKQSILDNFLIDSAWPAEIRRTPHNNNNGNAPKQRRNHRGKRAGIRNRLRAQAHRPPLPSILLANVQSLENKMDDLRARITFQRDVRDCNIICLTETWLTSLVPDRVICPSESFSVFRADRTEESGKSKGGGVCFMTNNNWCNPINVTPLSQTCSANLEHLTILCRPFYLPREFTSVIITAVYIPPQANTEAALSSLHDTLSRHQSNHPEAAMIITGDFNRANLRKVMPNFRQHITCATRGDRTLDHCYTQIKDAYKAVPCPPFGKSDHAAIMLMPDYIQRIARDPAVKREVKRWTAQSEAELQDALSDVDWDMFQSSSSDVSEFTDTVLDFISTLVDNIIPTRTVKFFPNQKPWVDNSIRASLRARTAAYNSGLTTGSMEEYKAESYSLRRAVKAAKRRYADRMEAQMENSDTRGLWRGLRTITDYRNTPPSSGSVNASLAEDLNCFYARFEASNTTASAPANNNNVRVLASATDESSPAGVEQALSVTEHDVRRTLLRVNTRKAAGPDGIPGRVLKICANQLAPVFTTIFNLSLANSTVPTCFKRSSIVPVPKITTPACLNDYRPVALTSVVMKCFERLVKDYICSFLPPTLDPLQFAYRPNRSTDDAVSQVLHTTLSHLDSQKGGYVRMLFIDYSSAFNTIVPTRLAEKMRDLGLSTSLCAWILDFLTARPQVVRVGRHTSSSLTLSTGSPQGCVLSPLLYSLYTHDCVAKSSDNSIIKFADDTVVVGLISGNNEEAYRHEVEDLVLWCQDNSLILNVPKTKEMIVDFRKAQHPRTYTPLDIGGTAVDRVSSFKYLGVHITEDLTWTTHINTLVGKARQRLFHLRQLRKFRVSRRILQSFYSGAVESILAGNITVWYGNSTAQDRRALQRVVRLAEKTMGAPSPPLHVLYTRRCRTRAYKIMKDPHHPKNGLFQLLRSGKRLRCHAARTERLRLSFFPNAIRTINDDPTSVPLKTLTHSLTS